MKTLTAKQKAIYNEFVDCLKNKPLTYFRLGLFKGDLFFELKSELGFSKEEVNSLFTEFISKYPKCGITYNMKDEPTILEQELIRHSDFILQLESGFKLEYL